ncbi:MFS transporter [Pseudomonas sp. RIT412]|nr:MFS transporter [Pseudomonas sp. RIT 409]RAU54210.1 MFS transporter [Pseudomonas sp. RIT 412]
MSATHWCLLRTNFSVERHLPASRESRDKRCLDERCLYCKPEGRMNPRVLSAPSPERLQFAQIRTVLLCAFIALMDGFDIQAMAVVTPQLLDIWHMKAGEFAPVLSASFAGIMLGTILLGQAGDRLGRRKVILFAFTVVGLASIATALATRVEIMMVLRFVTGFAIGGCLPNVTALTAEALPARFTGRAVTAMYCFVPLGGMLGGVAGSQLIERFDWQAVFIIGGVLPLITLLALLRWLPESSTVADSHRVDSRLLLGRPQLTRQVRALFQPRLRRASTLLWMTFFCSMASTYLLSSWLPTLFKAAGRTLPDAIHMMSLFQFGGVLGGLLLGYLVDRGWIRSLPMSFVIGGCMSMLIAWMNQASVYLSAVVVLAGAGVIGSQLCINALCARLYPETLRASGIGWALGIGRSGAIASPYLGGLAVSSSSGWESVFIAAAALTLLCGLSTAMLAATRTGQPMD